MTTRPGVQCTVYNEADDHVERSSHRTRGGLFARSNGRLDDQGTIGGPWCD